MAAEPYGEADPLKGGIECPFDNGFIGQGTKDFSGDGVAAGCVVNCDRAAVYGYAEQQDFKLVRFCVFVDTAFLDVTVTVSFKVYGYFFYFHMIFLSK